MDKRQSEAAPLQTCADKWSGGEGRATTGGSRRRRAGGEQMCSSGGVINMSHSTLEMAEGHRQL